MYLTYPKQKVDNESATMQGKNSEYEPMTCKPDSSKIAKTGRQVKYGCKKVNACACSLFLKLFAIVELYTHHNVMKKLLERLEKEGFRMCVVHLVDSHYCSDPGKYISTLLMTLSSMLQLGMPHINVLSKIDMAHHHSHKLQFNLEYYTEVLDLNYLLQSLDEDKFTKRYAKLNAAIIELVEDFSLVSFLPLSIKNRKMMLEVRAAADKANGYVYGSGEERTVQALLSCAIGATHKEDLSFTPQEESEKSTSLNESDELLWG